MDERTAFAVLEIESTKDEELIKRAYRRLLPKTNPEDNPEGFKRLRTAYEAACSYARQQEEIKEEEESSVEIWLKQVEEVYSSLSRRMDVREWKGLLEEDICQDLETGEEVKNKLFTFLMEHYRLPKQIWVLLNERFFIEEERTQFEEEFPPNFIDYMIDQIHTLAEFPFSLFQGEDSADYDTYVSQYFELYEAVQEDKKELAASLLDTLENSGITHPLVEIEKLYLEFSEERKQEICEKVKELLAKYPGEIRLDLQAANLLWKAGEQESAALYYRQVLKVIPKHYIANKNLFIYYKEKKEYQKAKKRGEEILRNYSSDQKMQEELVEINEHLIEKYREALEKQELKIEDYIEYAWCCLQNERYDEGIEVLLSIEPDDENAAGYYSVLERLYFSKEQPEKAEEMGHLWVEAVRKEEPDLDEEERAKVPERIAAAYYIMGRAWSQTKGKEERALEFLNQSIAFFDGNEDVFLHKILVLQGMHRNEEALEVCNQMLQKDEANFWAYVYRMDIYSEMKKGQEVIDNYNQARQIFPHYPYLYETAAETFAKHGQYQDSEEVLKVAQELGLDTPKLQYLKFKCMHRKAASREELEGVIREMENALEKLEADEQLEEGVDILAEMARCYSDLRDFSMALEYINRALKISEKPDFFWIKSGVLADLERYKEALLILRICEREFPDGDRVYSRIGICLYRLNELDRAKEYHEKALKLNKENERANSDILDIYKIKLESCRRIEERNRLYEEGLVYAGRQLQIRPEAYFYIDRGLFHLEAGNIKSALEDFRIASELEPDNVYAYQNAGTAYEKAGDYEKAIEYYEKAVTLQKPGQKPLVKARLGACLKKLGRYEEAEIYLLQYQEEHPQIKWVMRELFQLYICMGRTEEALQWIGRFCNKKQAEIMLEKAQMYMSLENGAEAEKCLKELLKLKYKPEKVYFMTAQNHLYILDKKRSALRAAKKALSLEKTGRRKLQPGMLSVGGNLFPHGKNEKSSSSSRAFAEIFVS